MVPTRITATIEANKMRKATAATGVGVAFEVVEVFAVVMDIDNNNKNNISQAEEAS